MTSIKHMYKGHRMQQHPDAIEVFTTFLNKNRFSRLIELGTGFGGFAMFLARTSSLSNLDFITIDHREKFSESALEELYNYGARRFVFDILKDANRVHELLDYNCRILLLCDNGHKISEFKEFAPDLKPNDVIMVHDYWKTPEDYKPSKEFKGNEIHYEDIQLCCSDLSLQEYYSDLLNPVGWGCFIRR